jgi:alpha-ketoglutarate-dependent taurine dioxygenase
MPISFKPLHQHFAAEVRDFDMRLPIDHATARMFERAIHRHGILVFPAQRVDDAQQLAFTANFGPPDIGRKKAVKSADSRIPEEMIDLSNLDENGYVIDPDHRRVLSLLGTRLWHTDSSYQRPAAKYSMLRAVVVPPSGGETEFADCRAAYDALPDMPHADMHRGCRYDLGQIRDMRRTTVLDPASVDERDWEDDSAESGGAMSSSERRSLRSPSQIASTAATAISTQANR